VCVARGRRLPSSAHLTSPATRLPELRPSSARAPRAPARRSPRVFGFLLHHRHQHLAATPGSPSVSVDLDRKDRKMSPPNRSCHGHHRRTCRHPFLPAQQQQLSLHRVPVRRCAPVLSAPVLIARTPPQLQQSARRALVSARPTRLAPARPQLKLCVRARALSLSLFFFGAAAGGKEAGPRVQCLLAPWTSWRNSEGGLARGHLGACAHSCLASKRRPLSS